MRSIEADDFQLYLSRVRPIYHQLFNIAHAITGSRDLAQYCMQCAFLNYWLTGFGSGSRRSFREGLRGMLIQTAFRETVNAKEAPECTWQRVSSEIDDPLHALIAQEPPLIQRVLALKYGCGLSRRRIARLLDTDAARIRTLLRRFEARACRRLSIGDRRNLDLELTHTIRSDFSIPSALAPEMGSVFRALEADALSGSTSSRLPARIFSGFTVVLLTLFCIAAFWLAAVLIQPAVIEDPEPIQAVETE